MPRRFDPGYSFRSGDFRERPKGKGRAPEPPSQIGSEEGQRPCARGEWCASSAVITEGGEARREAALGYQAFCPRDRTFVARCLYELPEQYVRLAAELGRPSSGSSVIRIPFGPRVPIRLDIDSLLRLIAESLVSWHERVADIARLDFPLNRASRLRREAVAVARAELVLSAHLDALLALESLPMSRAWSLRDLDDLPEGATGIVHPVFIDATVDLSGADAGLEIISLRHLARAVLGETRARPEELVGVPCRDPDGNCGWRSVYRAELPSREDEPVWWTECARCGDRMDEKTYREWVALCAAYERNRRKEPATLENLPGVA
jgi:hypothetical protein